MLFRLLIALVLALSLSNAFSAEVIDEVAIARIKAESLRHSEVGKTLGYLSDVYGPRLTGTPRYLEMVGWAAAQLREWGIENVWTERYGDGLRGWEVENFLFTSEKKTIGDYRQTILVPPGTLDRSPCGTGASARVALLYSRGEIGLNEPKKFEGPLGTCFIGQAVSAEERNGVTFITPRITGNAYITGYHQFVLDQDDPIPGGYRVGPAPHDLSVQ